MRKMLAIKWRGLGDTVLWTASLQALRDWYPDAELHVACPAAFAELFAADTGVSKVWPLTDKSIAEIYRLGKQFRAQRYDLFLGFHASSRLLSLALLSGAGERILHHHSRKPKNFFSQQRIPNLGVAMSAQERDLNVVRCLGWRGDSPSTRLVVSESNRASARQALLNAGWDGKRPLILLQPLATRPAKKWGNERYQKLAQLLSSSAYPLVIAETKSPIPGLPFLKTETLGTLMGALTHASVLVSGDSGVKHVACALGTPTVTLFGPESVGEWHGYDRKRHPVIQRQVLCRTHDPVPPDFAWCGAVVCPLGSHACLNQITAEDVLTEVNRLI